MNLILLVLLLVISAVCYWLIVLHISFLWRKIMKVSDYILFGVCFVAGCFMTYLLNC